MTVQCIQCEQELESVFPDWYNTTTDYQFDNALWLGFFGGYGMFVESPEYTGNNDSTLSAVSYEAVLCHDCAHKLCETLPWVKKLLKPDTSHTGCYDES